MSEPQQPPVPPSAQPQNPAPPAPPAAVPLPANPQYPAAQAPFPAQQNQARQNQAQQYPAQQYPVQQYPAPGGQFHAPSQPPYAAAPTSGSNPLARVALIVALATLALGLLFSLLTPFLLRMLDFSSTSYGLISGLSGLIALVGSVTALILGIVAARRPGQRLLVGIALGIAGAQVASVLSSWISGLFYTFF